MNFTRIYISSSGDTWDLMRIDGRIFVKHSPNVASGGQPSSFELGKFLTTNSHSAEVKALHDLIGSWIDREPIKAENDNGEATHREDIAEKGDYLGRKPGTVSKDTPFDEEALVDEREKGAEPGGETEQPI